MSAAYTADQRRVLAAALHAGEPLLCPSCNTVLKHEAVQPRPDVSYVRHRVWVICPTCRRSAALDVRAGEPP